MDYDKLKIFISNHKPKFVVVIVSIVMFVVGFGTGRGTHSDSQPSPVSSPQYSAKPAAKPAADGEAAAPDIAKPETAAKPAANTPKDPPLAATAEPKPAAVGKPFTPGEPCPVKGNISGKNKIYHIPSGAFYERTTPEQCFNTETEAQSAGFRKSGR